MLQLTYQGDTAIPVEVEGILPETVRELSLDAIRSLEIFHGNRQKQLGDFFSVEGDPSDCNWNMSGDLSGVHWIGTEMREGHIHIEGNAGRHLGSEMRGGLISCDGDVGDWAGGEMRGGRLQIRGNAGHLLGAAYRGSRRGMRGGTIIVQGNAGNEVGHTMRRGSILVGGKAGDMIGFNMLAGTLFVFGECGIRPGAGMRRGTLGLFAADPEVLLPTFRYGCRFEPLYLRLMSRSLEETLGPHASPGSESLPTIPAQVDLYHGDFLEGGRGELLLSAR